MQSAIAKCGNSFKFVNYLSFQFAENVYNSLLFLGCAGGGRLLLPLCTRGGFWRSQLSGCLLLFK